MPGFRQYKRQHSADAVPKEELVKPSKLTLDNTSAIVTASRASIAKTPKTKSPKKSSPPPYPADASKQDRMIALMTRHFGTTIEELVAATGWQQHSIRGAISGVLKKRMELVISSEMEARGRVYRIAGDRA